MKDIQWTMIPKFTHASVADVTFGGFLCSRFIASQPNSTPDDDNPDVGDSASVGTVPAFGIAGKPAWRYITYWEARKAAANANIIDGPGVHMLTAFEWASLAMLSDKYNCHPHGNNNNNALCNDVTYTAEKAVPDRAALARNAAYYASLVGTGPATWNILHHPNGPADLNGNMWEWVMGFHMQTADEVVNISAIDGDATTISVTTAAAHGLSVGDHVTIAGTVGYDGTGYVIATAVDTTHFTITDGDHDLDPEATGTAGHQGHAMVLATLDVALTTAPYGYGTGTLNTLTDSDKDWTVDVFIGAYLMDAAGARFAISDSDATTLTVSGTPTSGPYEIVIDTGVDLSQGCTSGQDIKTLKLTDADLKGFACPDTTAATDPSYGNDHFWFNTADAGTAPNNIRAAVRGGNWSDGAAAGVFARYLDLPPSYSDPSIGFRLGKSL